jgi:hypothetical protein
MIRAAWPGGEILRDITRGGLAGLVVGIVVAGLGGRLVMRLAALVVPSASGSFTENGNRIGEITVVGTAGLIVGLGLVATVLLATVWVAISPWLPGKGLVRGLVAMPIAIALGAFALIDSGNPDFVVLAHDPVVVAILLALVAMTAPAMAVVDGWLDRRLPHAVSGRSPVAMVYAALSVVGFVLGSFVVIQSLSGQEAQPVGLAVLGAGAVTIYWWTRRVQGARAPTRGMLIAGRTFLVAGTALGYIRLAPEVAGALGLD